MPLEALRMLRREVRLWAVLIVGGVLAGQILGCWLLARAVATEAAVEVGNRLIAGIHVSVVSNTELVRLLQSEADLRERRYRVLRAQLDLIQQRLAAKGKR